MGELQIKKMYKENRKGMEAKGKRLKFKEGDIFSIPIDDETTGYGQIVKIPNKSQLFIAVFSARWKKVSKIDLAEIISSNILFLGHTTDALLFHNRWFVIGNLTI